MPLCDTPLYSDRNPYEILKWANRASDLLFVSARWINALTKQPEKKWVSTESFDG